MQRVPQHSASTYRADVHASDGVSDNVERGGSKATKDVFVFGRKLTGTPECTTYIQDNFFRLTVGAYLSIYHFKVDNPQKSLPI